jgi:hypothetical protein
VLAAQAHGRRLLHRGLGHLLQHGARVGGGGTLRAVQDLGGVARAQARGSGTTCGCSADCSAR